MPSPNPLTTIEVRWFFAGAMAAHALLKQWFGNVRLGGQPRDGQSFEWNERTDTYLVLPNGEDMGIKLREGQLQLKGRLASRGTQTFCGRHQGVVEHWAKWSYADLPDAYHAFFGPMLQPGLITVPVRKRRALRKAQLDPNSGTVSEVSPDSEIDNGLGIELTELEVFGQRYCTVAFEAFPQRADIEALAMDGARTTLDQLRDIRLSAQDSYSYPAWLARLV